MDLRNDKFGLSGKLRSRFNNCSSISSKDFENLTCLFGQHLRSKIQTLDSCSNNTEIPCHCRAISQLHAPVSSCKAVSIANDTTSV